MPSGVLNPSRMRLRFLSSVAFIMLTGCLRLEPVSLLTEEGKLPAILNWSECAAFSEKDHPELLAAREAVKQARAAWMQSFEGFLPDASAEFERTRRQVDDAKATNSFSFATSVSEEWFSGFENTAEVLRARRNFRAEKFNYDDIESRIALETRQAFVRLLHAQELAVLRNFIAERRKLNEEIVRLRYEGGREHRGSLKRAEAIYNEAMFDVREAERSIITERNALARELGGRYEMEPAVSGDLEIMISSAPESRPDFAALAEIIPSVLRRRELKDAAGANVIAEQSDFWPTVTGSASYANSGRTPDMNTRTWDAGFSINFPIFSGGEELAGLYSARSDQREAFYTLKDVRDSAYADLIEKWTEFLNAVEFVEVRKKFLGASVERAEISSIQYQDGLVSFKDWDDIEQELVNSRIALLNALRDAVLAEADWLRSQGLSFDAYRA
ncbi:MAG: TolC family protein [Candidatus Omnitrophica bacterium]|nr:TolC family protein [Candidatus Omnitrophota bacterium]